MKNNMYDEFSKVYDKFQDIDYDKFVGFYLDIFKKRNMSPELILDLACGTGNITIPMAKLGYNMIGLDISTEMLNIARQKAAETETKHDILFLQQDMTEFELYGTVDVIICALDGINYLSGPDELEDVFALVHIADHSAQGTYNGILFHVFRKNVDHSRALQHGGASDSLLHPCVQQRTQLFRFI